MQNEMAVFTYFTTKQVVFSEQHYMDKCILLGLTLMLKVVLLFLLYLLLKIILKYNMLPQIIYLFSNIELCRDFDSCKVCLNTHFGPVATFLH